MKTLSFTISSFCKTGSGTTPSRDKYDRYFNGTIPWVKSGELRESIISFTDEKVTEAALAETSLKIAPKGAILVAMYGANVGRVGILGIDATTNQAVCYIVPDEDKACARYIFHALQQKLPEFILRSVGGAQPNISQEIIKRTEIFLPPLEEQKRIAEILDRAESLRAMRRQSIEQLNTLTQAIFLEMFGDPVANGWAMTTVNEMVHPSKGSIRSGPFGSQLLHSEFTEEGVAVLGIDNAVANEFRWDKRRFISELKYQKLRRYTVRPDDVLITIMGTCGRCAIVPDDIPLAINTKHLCCITLDLKKCLSRFLHAYFLLHPIARQYLNQTRKGAIMDGLNMSIIQSMPIPITPLTLQNKFAQRVEAIEKLKTTHQKSLIELDALFASLQHRAFRGEL
jgi:type I restriction enzyme, S subunit